MSLFNFHRLDDYCKHFVYMPFPEAGSNGHSVCFLELFSFEKCIFILIRFACSSLLHYLCSNTGHVCSNTGHVVLSAHACKYLNTIASISKCQYRLIDWFRDWLAGWWDGWLIGWMVDWLASFEIGWLGSEMVGWLVGWLADLLI